MGSAAKPPFGARTDKSSPLARGLAGLWLFNEPGGLRVFDAAGSNHGVMTNMAMPSTSTSGRGQSRLGPCMVYDGTNDNVVVTHAPSLAILGDMTIAAWVYLRTYVGYSGILSKVKSAAVPNPAPYDYWIETGTGKPALLLGDGTASTLVYSTLAIPLNTWTFVAATLSGTGVTHYLGGVANGTGTNTTTRADLGTDAGIGGRADNGTSLKGSLGQVRLYNRALSAGEIMELYRSPYAGVLAPSQRFPSWAIGGPPAPRYGFFRFM